MTASYFLDLDTVESGGRKDSWPAGVWSAAAGTASWTGRIGYWDQRVRAGAATGH
jgi:hypothetical protein